MVVICVCGQKNRVGSKYVTGQKTAKAINCGHCKQSLADIMAIQVDRNSDIILAIAELFIEKNERGGGEFDTHREIQEIFKKNGMDLGPHEIDEEDVEDLDEDDEDEDLDVPDEDEDEIEDEPEPPKKKKKKVVKAKSKSKRTH